MKSLVLRWSCLWTCLAYAVSHKFQRDNHLLHRDDQVFDIRMPNVAPFSNNQYLCIAMKIDTDEAFITSFEPHAKSSRAHHMLLFGSSVPSQHVYPGYWDCTVDQFRGKKILYAWAKNAGSVVLPKDVGFHVGQSTSTRYLILQVHYARKLPGAGNDSSGFRLLMTMQRQKYMAGIFLMSDSKSVIPPALRRSNVDVSCNPDISQPIFVFAYRVHTHDLGYSVRVYKYNTRNSTLELMVRGNPKWPQVLYPLDSVYNVTSDDVLVARCSYDSTSRSENTHMGRGTKDEMCNAYLMYYTEEDKAESQGCQGNDFPRLVTQLPEGSDEPIALNPDLEEQAQNDELPQMVSQLSLQDINISKKGHGQIVPDINNLLGDYEDLVKEPSLDEDYQYKDVLGWPAGNLTLGQVTAVSMDSEGNIVVFHRGSHTWNAMTFDYMNNYRQEDEGPIVENTVLILEPKAGRVINKWGSNMFFMPHGLTIDSKGFAWLTDVALHQVFKFPEKGAAQADLILGERFKPGQDNEHFCKPTSVAIASTGEFYVADGYCNGRILKYSREGKYLSQWGHENPIFRGTSGPLPPGAFQIPHKVILADDESLVCVADRENGRAQCFNRNDETFAFAIQREEFHGRLFSIAATPGKDGLLYGVCGPSVTSVMHPVQAFVFNLTSKDLLNVITPRQGTFAQPHDLAVSTDTETMYVAEIGPNILWKFKKATHKSAKKVLPTGSPPHEEVVPSSPPVPLVVDMAHSSQNETKGPSTGVVVEASNFATSMVIMALLGIPILLLILITVIVRLRKRGRFQQCSLPQVKGWLGGYRTPHGSHEKFNIGSLLNPHKGFDRVALDESDLDVEEKSDSEVEEFNAASTRKA